MHQQSSFLTRSVYICRYGFSEDCTVVNWSGDNPNSFAGKENPSNLLLKVALLVMYGSASSALAFSRVQTF